MAVVWPLCIFLAVWAAGWVVRRIVLRLLNAWSRRTQSRAGIIFTQAIKGPALIWTAILGVHLAVQSSDLPARFTHWSAQALLVLWIVSFTLMLMKIAGDLVRYYGNQVPGALPVTTLTQTLAQVGVVLLGGAILMQELGISITPYLTALGVGGLAVALALQDTLSNLFSGFYVAVAGQIRLGDYIKLNTGEEGYVADIGWRSTLVRSLTNNLIIVPNAKLAQAIVTNYHLPDKRLSAGFQINVPMESDVDLVERVLLDELRRGAKQIDGMVADATPSVALEPGFGDFYLAFSVNYTVAEFASQGPVRNELRKRIHKRFQLEGIRLPYPTRTVYLQNESTALQRTSDGRAREASGGADGSISGG